MLAYIAFVVVLFCSEVQDASGEACTTKSKLTAEEMKEALEHHNLARSNAGNGDAANEVKLVWNDALARRAQDWANLCVWKHTLLTACDEKTPIGQNLAYTTSKRYTIAKFVYNWDKEKAKYTYQTGACSGKCGHYTQVVWANTMEVGCGIAHCPEVDGGPNGAWMFGCDYSPPGNYIRQKPYVLGVPCSECATVLSGGYMCEENLCTPCTPKEDGRKCTCETRDCKNGGNFNKPECRCDCPSDYYGNDCEKKCECVDPSPHCYAWKGYCDNRSYANFMKTNCPKTCKMCDLPDSCFA